MSLRQRLTRCPDPTGTPRQSEVRRTFGKPHQVWFLVPGVTGLEITAVQQPSLNRKYETNNMTTFYLKKPSGRLPLRTTLSPGTGPVRRAFARKYVLPLLLIELAVLAALSVQAQSTYEPYSFTTFAGLPPGSADGTGSAARFNSPAGVALDSAGNTYVADTVNSTIRKITPAGVVTTFAGLAGSTGSANGTGNAARFNGPVAVAID